MNTYEIHHKPDYPYYVVEHRHDGQVWPSTQTALRCVAGPYLTNREAAVKCDELDADAEADA